MTGKAARVLRPSASDAVPACVWLFIGAVCLFAAASLDPGGWHITALWIVGPLFIALGVFWLWLIASTRLALDDQGFTYARGGRTHRREWSEVQAVNWITGDHQRFSRIEITFKSPKPPFAFLSSREVVHDQIESRFGMGGRKLADLMNEHRQTR